MKASCVRLVHLLPLGMAAHLPVCPDPSVAHGLIDQITGKIAQQFVLKAVRLDLPISLRREVPVHLALLVYIPCGSAAPTGQRTSCVHERFRVAEPKNEPLGTLPLRVFPTHTSLLRFSRVPSSCLCPGIVVGVLAYLR